MILIFDKSETIKIRIIIIKTKQNKKKLLCILNIYSISKIFYYLINVYLKPEDVL